MDDTTQAKAIPKPRAKSANKPNHSKNRPKSRTHIPVEGHTIEKLREFPMEDLLKMAKELGVENPQELKRQELMFSILQTQTNQGGFVLFTGILEIPNEEWCQYHSGID